MKLSKAEAKALKFVLFLMALSAFARWRSQPAPPVVDSSAVAAVPERVVRHDPDAPIDPNAASVADLDRLPGIGHATAAKIVAGRPYRDLNHFAEVVGKKRAVKLAPLLTLRAAEPKTAEPHKVDALPASLAPINLNRAEIAELERLPGVGPSLARRIVARRDSLNKFRTWEQVDSIRGVGPALLKKIKGRAVL